MTAPKEKQEGEVAKADAWDRYWHYTLVLENDSPSNIVDIKREVRTALEAGWNAGCQYTAKKNTRSPNPKAGGVNLTIDLQRLERSVNFLNESARYFEKRPTGGEDKAHWSNVFNGKNCREIANLLTAIQSQIKGAGRE